MMQKSSHEKGMVLVVVLGLVALVSTWAVTAAYEDTIALHRAENMLDSSKAWLASESAANLAQAGLMEDATLGKFDHLDEQWAQDAPAFPVDNGSISGRLLDLNHFLNVNDLVDNQGKAREQEVQVMKRLFVSLDVPPLLVDALVDWLDVDGSPFSSYGAEDMAYMDREYHIKNARLDSWDELRLVQGFDAVVLEKLRDAVAVWSPFSDALSVVNVNTAPAVVLQALFPNMLEADALSVEDGRPYEDMNVLQQQAWVAGGPIQRLSVSSQFFMAETEAVFGRAHWKERYVLQRHEDGRVQILRRYREL